MKKLLLLLVFIKLFDINGMNKKNGINDGINGKRKFEKFNKNDDGQFIDLETILINKSMPKKTKCLLVILKREFNKITPSSQNDALKDFIDLIYQQEKKFYEKQKQINEKQKQKNDLDQDLEKQEPNKIIKTERKFLNIIIMPPAKPNR